MGYPDNFETPAFPAGKRIAVSRMMSIGTSIAFLLIAFLCGFILWTAQSQRLTPFVISSDNETGEWVVVGKSKQTLEYSVNHTVQESLVVKFTRNWFSIASDEKSNQNKWCQVERTDCANVDSPCEMYCLSSDEVFTRFVLQTLPEYKLRVEAGETWYMVDESIKIKPISKISERGGAWLFNAVIISSISGPFRIEAYVNIGHNKNYYPQTFGFYISDFNAYRISK